MPERRYSAQHVIDEVEKAVVGKRDVLTKIMTAILAGGHILIEDIPGTGKTTMALAFSKAMGLETRRVQFTPDVLPSDLTGINFYNQKTGEFEFRPGPLFSHIVLADEINRATPRTQSSLLECMAEGQVTVDGVTRELEPPFFVIATQNPVETLGTYPLPEAQLDRFLMRVSMDAPDLAGEVAILERFQPAEPLDALQPVCGREELLALQQAAEQVKIHPALLEYMARLAQASRSFHGVELGVSPRGTLSLMRASRAYAFVQQREYVVPEDIKAVAVPVLAHRLAVTGGVGSQAQKQAVEELLQSVPVPTEDWT